MLNSCLGGYKFQRLNGFSTGFLIKQKKGVRYGCEEDFDDRWGFCRGL